MNNNNVKDYIDNVVGVLRETLAVAEATQTLMDRGLSVSSANLDFIKSGIATAQAITEASVAEEVKASPKPTKTPKVEERVNPLDKIVEELVNGNRSRPARVVIKRVG